MYKLRIEDLNARRKPSCCYSCSAAVIASGKKGVTPHGEILNMPKITLELKDKMFVFDHHKIKDTSLPIGKAEVGETPFDTLCRELREEVNIDVLSAGYMGSMNYNIPNTRTWIRIDVFYVYSYLGEVTNLEPEKHTNARWERVGNCVSSKSKASSLRVFSEFAIAKRCRFDRMPIFYSDKMMESITI